MTQRTQVRRITVAMAAIRNKTGTFSPVGGFGIVRSTFKTMLTEPSVKFTVSSWLPSSKDLATSFLTVTNGALRHRMSFRIVTATYVKTYDLHCMICFIFGHFGYHFLCNFFHSFKPPLSPSDGYLRRDRRARLILTNYYHNAGDMSTEAV